MNAHHLSRLAASIACLIPLSLAGCGGDEPTGTFVDEDIVVEESVEAPSGVIAAPGSRMGLGASGDASGDFDSGDFANDNGGGNAAASAATSEPATPRDAAREAPEAPEPPAVPIAVPQPKDPIEAAFSDTKSLERSGADPRYSEFRELCDRNTEMLVKLARARKAMKSGGANETTAYLKIDEQYAEFSERLNDYMAQRRWSEQDREVMGYLLSVSTEDAMRRVREGS